MIPARNEVETIGITVQSLIEQDYPGTLSIIVVDDNSDDGTAEAAKRAGADRVRVIDGAALPSGWSGKMWAVSQGVAAAEEVDYILLTDADIVHAPDNLRGLADKAVTGRLGLVSLMVRLNAESVWERLLIPAFVYFFQKLYPFPRVNDPADTMAAAAGGCMLVEAGVLRQAGGIERIKDKIIDDCALAAIVKPVAPIWLGLTDTTRSVRRYQTLSDIWSMVARTAYEQLKHNPLLLAGTVAGMLFVYFAPIAVLAASVGAGQAMAATASGLACAMMFWSYLPALDLYRMSPVWTFSLPAAAVLYTLMTLDSAHRHYQGRGGAWKGRTY